MTQNKTPLSTSQNELFLLIRGLSSLMRFNANRCRALEDEHDNELCAVKRQGMAEAYDDCALMLENFFEVKNALDLSTSNMTQCESQKEV